MTKERKKEDREQSKKMGEKDNTRQLESRSTGILFFCCDNLYNFSLFLIKI